MAYPTNPTTGDTYVLGSKTWTYNGTNWVNQATFASGSSASVAFSDLTSTPTTLAGYGITDGGSGSGGGAMEFIASSGALSNVADVSFTQFDATKYDHYVFALQNVIPDTNGANLFARLRPTGSSTYSATSGNYETAGSARTAFVLADSVGTNTHGYGVGGLFNLYALHLTDEYTFADTVNLIYTRNNGVTTQTISYAGAGNIYKQATAVDAIRFFFSSGNIFSGEIVMYGIRNSASGGGGAGGGSVAFSDLTSTPTTLAGYGITDGASESAAVGTVIYHSANTAPTGFIKANGAAISRTTYADLFTAIGTTFGSGDGSSTFNVPDLRGEFPRGWDDGRGIDASRSFGSAQADQMESHNHSVPSAANFGGNHDRIVVGTGVFSSNNASTDFTGGTSNSSENRPRNIALLACIKYQSTSSGGGGGSLSNIVEDTTPQLGGNLDAQTFDITTTGKILYANMYATEGDLPSATTYHGMFAHVHGTGAGYFAHGGNWIKLANHADLSSASGSTTAGGVGTYSLLGKADGSTTSLGTDVSGSSLRYSSTYSYSPSYYGMSGSAPSGTWRCMSVGGAYNLSTTAANSTTVTIFLRIS